MLTRKWTRNWTKKVMSAGKSTQRVRRLQNCKIHHADPSRPVIVKQTKKKPFCPSTNETGGLFGQVFYFQFIHSSPSQRYLFNNSYFFTNKSCSAFILSVKRDCSWRTSNNTPMCFSSSVHMLGKFTWLLHAHLSLQIFRASALDLVNEGYCAEWIQREATHNRLEES